MTWDDNSTNFRVSVAVKAAEVLPFLPEMVVFIEMPKGQCQSEQKNKFVVAGGWLRRYYVYTYSHIHILVYSIQVYFTIDDISFSIVWSYDCIHVPSLLQYQGAGVLVLPPGICTLGEVSKTDQRPID